MILLVLGKVLYWNCKTLHTKPLAPNLINVTEESTFVTLHIFIYIFVVYLTTLLESVTVQRLDDSEK
jgi:hypothetical protein